MWLLPIEATDDEIIARCRAWVELVAAGEFDEAVRALRVSTGPGEGFAWTSETLREWISNYASWTPRAGGRRWRLTSLLTAKSRPDRPGEQGQCDLVHVDFEDGEGSVDIDLAMDGYWSDLTALFRFRRAEGGIALLLSDLRVL
jgi:hypothetical protein